jgi:hypothetical protein
VWSLLIEGQLTPLPLLGAALLLPAARGDRASRAVAGGMLLAVKPHFLPAYLIVLIASRRWQALLGASLGATAVLLSPLAAGGLDGLSAMVHNVLGTNGLVPVRLTEAWVGLLAAVLPASLITPLGFAIYAGALAILAFIAASRRSLSLVPFAALALCVSMLASPHVLPHDLLLLLPAVWLGFWLQREGRIPSLIPVLILVDLAVLIDLRGLPLVLGPIAMTAALAWAAFEFRRRADLPRAEDVPAAA